MLFVLPCNVCTGWYLVNLNVFRYLWKQTKINRKNLNVLNCTLYSWGISPQIWLIALYSISQSKRSLDRSDYIKGWSLLGIKLSFDITYFLKNKPCTPSWKCLLRGIEGDFGGDGREKDPLGFKTFFRAVINLLIPLFSNRIKRALDVG